jgi:hypothetical protein
LGKQWVGWFGVGRFGWVDQSMLTAWNGVRPDAS